MDGPGPEHGMQGSWNRVDLTRVAELRALVEAARELPTGRAVMDELAIRPTNLRIHTDTDWDAGADTRNTYGIFDGAQNTMHLPQRALVQTDPADARDDLLTFVHESVHRTQLPARLPGATHAVQAILVQPWRMSGSAMHGAIDAARAGTSPLRGARDGAIRSTLQVEVEAFDVEQRLAADIARRDGLPVPQLRSPDEIAASIRDDYAGQTRRAVLAGTAALGLQGAVAAAGVSELRQRGT